MANSDKDILITTATGVADVSPTIVFTGADGANSDAITLSVNFDGTSNVSTLSFEGSAGQLFSLTNSFTGTIFGVNDISGIPSIEVDEDGQVRLAEFTGNVMIGYATDQNNGKLQVNGDTNIAGNANISGNTNITGTATVGGLVASGDITFSTNTVIATGTGPKYTLIETGAAADEGRWDIFADGGDLRLRAVNDANNTAISVLRVQRTGVQIDSMDFSASQNSFSGSMYVTDLGNITVRPATQPFQVSVSSNSKVVIGESSVGSANPYIALYRTSSGLESGRGVRWYQPSSNGAFSFQQADSATTYGDETYTDVLSFATAGQATFKDDILLGVNKTIHGTSSTDWIRLSGGPAEGTGGSLILYGATHSTAPAGFRLYSGATEIIGYNGTTLAINDTTTFSSNVSATGNISAGNISATGNITSGGFISNSLSYDSGAKNLISTDGTDITLGNGTANITTASPTTVGANLAVTGTTTLANVSAGNITATSNITATGNISAGNITATGNITGPIISNSVTAGTVRGTTYEVYNPFDTTEGFSLQAVGGSGTGLNTFNSPSNGYGYDFKLNNVSAFTIGQDGNISASGNASITGSLRLDSTIAAEINVNGNVSAGAAGYIKWSDNVSTQVGYIGYGGANNRFDIIPTAGNNLYLGGDSVIVGSAVTLSGALTSGATTVTSLTASGAVAFDGTALTGADLTINRGNANEAVIALTDESSGYHHGLILKGNDSFLLGRSSSNTNAGMEPFMTATLSTLGVQFSGTLDVIGNSTFGGTIVAANDIYTSRSSAGNAVTIGITNTGNAASDKMDLDFTSGTSLRGRIRTEVVGAPFYGDMIFYTALGGGTEVEQLRLGNQTSGASAQFAGTLGVGGATTITTLAAVVGGETFVVNSDGGGMYFGGTTSGADVRILAAGNTALTLTPTGAATFAGDVSVAKATGNDSNFTVTSGAGGFFATARDNGSGRLALGQIINSGGTNNIIDIGFGDAGAGVTTNSVMRLFQNADIQLRAGAAIRLDLATDNLSIGGGSAEGVGAELYLYGQSHGSVAADYVFYTGGVARYQFDHSADIHYFYGDFDVSGNQLALGGAATQNWLSGYPALSFRRGGVMSYDVSDGSYLVMTAGCAYIPSTGWAYTQSVEGAAIIQLNNANISFRHANAGTANGAVTWIDTLHCTPTEVISYKQFSVTDSVANYVMTIQNTRGLATTDGGLKIAINTASAARALSCFTSGAERFYCDGTGATYNTTGTYGTISDRDRKQDIELASSQLADLEAIYGLRRKFRMKDDVDMLGAEAPYLLGVIAQELLEVCPHLVSIDTNTPCGDKDFTYQVKQSIMSQKAVFGVGELSLKFNNFQSSVVKWQDTRDTRIAELEAQVAAQAEYQSQLESRLAALENR